MRPAKIPPPSDDLAGDECERCCRIYPDENYNNEPGFCCAPWGRDRDCETLYLTRLETQAQRDQATIAAARKVIEAADGVPRGARIGSAWSAYDAVRAEFAEVAPENPFAPGGVYSKEPLRPYLTAQAECDANPMLARRVAENTSGFLPEPSGHAMACGCARCIERRVNTERASHLKKRSP